MEDNPYRLPRNAVPSRYELTIEPDLDAASFTGSVVIDLTITEAAEELKLNTAELEIDEVGLVDSSGRWVGATTSHDEQFEVLTLHLTDTAAAGAAQLHVRFRGILNDKLRGFYRSTFEDTEGVSQTIATTHFEASDARRAFPCWDEPDLKAVFSVTLVVPEDLFAVSNARELSREPAGEGKVAVRFADTIRMSTYLVAFVVGPLEATAEVDVDGVPLRVVYPIGKGHLTDYALEVGAFCLRYFSDYYGIPYPGDKCDFIALPDFAFGAMENLGAITYRESLVLVDPELAGYHERRRIADVIAHELAHMWFGDLVTMRWWNGIWLNEAFATFMEMKAIDAYRPDWKRWLHFATKQSLNKGAERFDALGDDALTATRPVEYDVQSPDDADGMFDALTYGKGSAVLRMLEQFVGEDVFRDGIRHYLKTHEYANTETDDLWHALEAATDVPVRGIMDGWIFQPGYPVVEIVEEEGSITARQRRFTYVDQENAEASWKVPLLVKEVGSPSAPRRMLLEKTAEVSQRPPIVVNGGGSGFFRTSFSESLLARLADELDSLGELERFVVLDDARAMVIAGRLSAADFLDLAYRFRRNDEQAAWRMILAGVKDLHLILEGAAEPDMARFVRDLVAPVADQLGWEPRDGEPDGTGRLRAVLLEAKGHLGQDEDTVTHARGIFERFMEDPRRVDPDVAQAATFLLAQHGDAGVYEQFFEFYKNAETPQEETRFLFALAEFPTNELAERTLSGTLSGDIRTQDGPFVISRMILNKSIGSHTWELLQDRWDEAISVFPPVLVYRVLDYIYALSRPDVAETVTEFLSGRTFPLSTHHLPRRLEELRVHTALREREATRLPEWLRDRKK